MGSLPALLCFWEDAGAGGEGLSLERDIQVLGLLLGRIWGSWPPLGSRLVELQVMLVVPPLFLQGGKGGKQPGGAVPGSIGQLPKGLQLLAPPTQVPPAPCRTCCAVGVSGQGRRGEGLLEHSLCEPNSCRAPIPGPSGLAGGARFAGSAAGGEQD